MPKLKAKPAKKKKPAKMPNVPKLIGDALKGAGFTLLQDLDLSKLSPKDCFPDALEGKTDVTEGYIYSTMKVGVGAQGRESLFTIPRGQRMPSIGVGGPLCAKCNQEAGLVSGEEHTNIQQAGQLGYGLGDAAFKTVRVVADGMGSGVEARLSIVVAGRPQFSAPLNTLLNKVEPHALSVPILCAHTDTLEVHVTFDKPTTPADLPSGFSLLRVELAGHFARDAR